MNDGMRGDVVRQIDTLFNLGVVGGLTDGQLLERFAARGDEAAELAFAALVERHGPTVLRVCRGVLRDSHDAEDAFQATFLVLARKARSIRRCDSVGSWLYGVALRVSSDARERAARRRLHERRAAQMSTRTARGEGDDEVRLVVQEEVGRLPERYRAAIILCDLEGRTGEDAARLLGWPLGTVRSRLARARQRLRGRLVRRGLAPSLVSAGELPAGLQWPDRAVDVPPALAEATVRAAIHYSASRAAAAGTVPATVAALTEGALRTMMIAKLKTALTTAFLIGAALAGTGVMARQPRGPRADPALAPQAGRPIFSSTAGTAGEAGGRRVPDLERGSPANFLARNDSAVTTEPADPPGGLQPRGPSLQELEILLAQAKRRLARNEALVQRAVTGQGELEEARTEVDLMLARIEARRDDLRDELERLEGRLAVKEAEQRAVEIRIKAMAEARAANERPNLEAIRGGELQAELVIKQAEADEIKIRINQVKRRLKSQPQPK